MTSKMRRSLMFFALVILIGGAFEFIAYTISRSTGDFTFLAASIVLAICAARLGMIAKAWPIAMLIAGSTSLSVLALNACFADFIRNAYFVLGESFGQSALYGSVVLFVCSLTLLSTIGVGILVFARKSA